MTKDEEDALVNLHWVQINNADNALAAKAKFRFAIRAAYAKGREDAAKVCESLCADYYPHAKGPYLDCAAAIRGNK